MLPKTDSEIHEEKDNIIEPNKHPDEDKEVDE
jgi:hypothetical protein